MKKIFILFTIVFLSFLGCNSHNNSNYELEEIYNVLGTLSSYITNKKMVFYALPAPPPIEKVSLDSIIELYRNKDTTKLINSLVKKNGRLIVAVDPKLNPPYLLDAKKYYLQKCLKQDFNEVYSNFKSIKDTVDIDVSKIQMDNYSFIIPYRDHYKSLTRKGCEKFNVLLKFSRIAFNKDYTKAIVIMSAGFGKLNGFSAVYFLDKDGSTWVIKCDKGLTIS
ncbi:MAG: hypothetical protein GKR88_00800 [Flavobacteriaceae bacterium]|nr:MAG: hypothetical protein GKR88_00800 [Flavobacteriaceae bacterium]